MTRFHFERVDGPPKSGELPLIHLNEFVPPQGYGGSVIPPPVVGTMEYENFIAMEYEDLVDMGYEA